MKKKEKIGNIDGKLIENKYKIIIINILYKKIKVFYYIKYIKNK